MEVQKSCIRSMDQKKINTEKGWCVRFGQAEKKDILYCNRIVSAIRFCYISYVLCDKKR